MNAIRVAKADGEPQLVWSEAAMPIMAPADVLIRVEATAVNRADLSQARGNYPPPPGVTEILGLELAGVVVDLGKYTAGVAVGDRICALVPGGGYAEYAAVDYRTLFPMPSSMSFEEAAAIPEAWLTAFLNLVVEGQLKADEWVLIHAGASGVGTAAIQIVRFLGGRALATAGSDQKVAACEELGAVGAWNYRTRDFGPAVRDHTSGAGVDLILDPVGASHFDRNIGLLKMGGRMVSIATMSGSQVYLDLRQLMGRRLRLSGSTLRNRPLEEKIRLGEQFRTELWPHFATGILRPIIDTTMPVQMAEEAHQYVSENRNIGKVVLKIGSD